MVVHQNDIAEGEISCLYSSHLVDRAQADLSGSAAHWETRVLEGCAGSPSLEGQLHWATLSPVYAHAVRENYNELREVEKIGCTKSLYSSHLVDREQAEQTVAMATTRTTTAW